MTCYLTVSAVHLEISQYICENLKFLSFLSSTSSASALCVNVSCSVFVIVC